MPEFDSTYEFKALTPEERARIARDKLEQMERDFFNAQVGFSIQKASIDPTNVEEMKAFTDEKKRQMAEHKKRLTVGNALFAEAQAAVPKSVEEDGS